VARSPSDALPSLPAVLLVALEALRHDPNFADDMAEDGGDAGGESGDGVDVDGWMG